MCTYACIYLQMEEFDVKIRVILDMKDTITVQYMNMYLDIYMCKYTHIRVLARIYICR